MFLLLLCSLSQLDLIGSVPLASVPMARMPYWRVSASAVPSPSPWLAQYQLLLAQQAYYRPQPGLESRTSLAHLVGGHTSQHTGRTIGSVEILNFLVQQMRLLLHFSAL